MATAKQEQLLALKARLREGGGEKAVAKQHAAGKQTARERLEMCIRDRDGPAWGRTPGRCPAGTNRAV